MIECKISDIIGAAFICSFVVLAVLGAINIDSALEGTSKWVFFIIGAFSATVGSVLGGSE